MNYCFCWIFGDEDGISTQTVIYVQCISKIIPQPLVTPNRRSFFWRKYTYLGILKHILILESTSQCCGQSLLFYYFVHILGLDLASGMGQVGVGSIQIWPYSNYANPCPNLIWVARTRTRTISSYTGLPLFNLDFLIVLFYISSLKLRAPAI